MECLSFCSLTTDAYRAGSEIGEGLRALRPEVIILFTSPNYQADIQGLWDGLLDNLGNVTPVILGCSCDGIYETRGVASHGVSAFAMNSNGTARWTVATATGVDTDSFTAAQACARQALEALDGKADFALTMTDGVKSVGSRIVDGLRSVLPCPFIGGLASDSRKFASTFVLVDGKALENTVAVLLGRGDIRLWMDATSGWTPMGEQGFIEACHDNIIERISGRTAFDFIRIQLGKAPGEVDLGVMTLAADTLHNSERTALLAPLHFDADSGAVTMHGTVERGAPVYVCTATGERAIAGVTAMLDKHRPEWFTPAGALIVSCAGRKWAMGDLGRKELDCVLGPLGRDLPVAGFPSLGEFAPWREADGSYTTTHFHNVTCVICLIGK